MSNMWRARLDGTRGGVYGTLGAGFLIDERRVVTCAHIVRESSDIRVTFCQARRADLVDVPARVIFIGPWSGPGDAGDVAVVELAHETGLAPARLKTSLSGVGRLVAHGFPKDAGQSGSTLPLRPSSADGVGEWVHIEAASGHAEFPRRGFSGAAAYDETTGTVYGMITEASRAPELKTGRMLPVETIRAYWEEIDDILDLGWLPGGERRRLRRILHEAAITVPCEALVARVFPGTARPRDLRSVWDTVRYVGEEVMGDDRLVRFLDAVGRHLTDPDRRVRLSEWVRSTLAVPADQPQQHAAIVVRLEPRTKGGYDVSFSTLIDGVSGPPSTILTADRKDVRECVEKTIPVIMERLSGRDPIIEFALPQELLNVPVDEWYADPAHLIPMYSYRVVVRYVARMNSGNAILQDKWIVRSKKVRAEPWLPAGMIGCAPGHEIDLYHWLLSQPELCVVVLSSRPTDSALRKILNSGVPVALWPRAKCPAADHTRCDRKRLADDVSGRVNHTTFDKLPEMVRELRLNARLAPREPHVGHRLTLLWDDPDRLPEPPTYMDC
jgi:hypothetical protein